MRNLSKYVLFVALFIIMACSNTAPEKEAAATVATPPVKKEVVKEQPKPVLVDNKEVVISTSVSEVPTPVENKKPSTKVAPKKAIKKQTELVEEKTKVKKTKEVATPKVTETNPSKPTKAKKLEEEVVKTTTLKPTPKKEEIEKSTASTLSHDAWNNLAQKHISAAGKVSYKGFKAAIADFEAYLQSLKDNPVQDNWSKEKKMAYWINAYNAFTIKLIVDNYPVKSIMDLHGGKPWDVKWIKLGDKTYSLNNIEHDILRPKYKDARIHFAVNCAAKSCPPVWNQAWTEKNLNAQLEKSANRFINNSKYNAIGNKEVAISKIFDWYGEDFGNIIDYLNKYSDTKINSGTKVTYKDYDWALNE